MKAENDGPILNALPESSEAHGSEARYWCGVVMSEQYVIEWATALGWKPTTACGVHDAIAILREWGHKVTILAPPNEKGQR